MQSLGKTCRNETKMTEAAAESGKIAKALKKYLITGVLVWLPIAVTIWAMSYIISAADKLINLLPESWQPQHFWGFNIPGLGIVAATVVLFVTGVFAANVLGRRILGAWDSLLGRIPVVKSIYSSVKKSFRIPALRQQPLVQNPRTGSLSATGHLDDGLCFRPYPRQTQRQPAAR